MTPTSNKAAPTTAADVCSDYLCGMCPFDVLENTPSSMGSCRKVHSDEAKQIYMDSIITDPGLSVLDEHKRSLTSILQKRDHRVEQAKTRLHQRVTETEEIISWNDKIDALELDISEYIIRRDNVPLDEVIHNLNALKNLTKQQSTLLERTRQLQLHPPASQERQLKVCTMCASFLDSNISDKRMALHEQNNMEDSRQNLLSVDTDLESGEQLQPTTGTVTDYFKQSSRFFYLVFRLGALLTYLLGSIFTDNFTSVFVITIFLLAFDFWTVKNVSGRLLIGLRWWNEIQEDLPNKWVFGSANVSKMLNLSIQSSLYVFPWPNHHINTADSRLFWTILYGTPVLWILFALSCIFTFKATWLVIVVMTIILNMANVIGYTQCDKNAKRKWATGMAAQSAFGSLASGAGFVGKAVSSGLG
ncbi:hypothetical protein BC941DRAFT_510674 [Chlamydoabsidia padenii]|nr:hypothetical protein BC941DRAFT_510674 [Chlamydoabsidia padenii]